MTKEKPLSEKKNQINLYGKQFNYLKIEDVALAVEKLKEDIIDMRDYVGLIHFNRVIVQINSIFGSFDTLNKEDKLIIKGIARLSGVHEVKEDTPKGCGEIVNMNGFKWKCGDYRFKLCPKCSEVGK